MSKDVPNYVEAALLLIRERLVIILFNRHKDESDPFGNTGAEFMDAKSFKVRAFDWSDPDEYDPNFEWRDFKVEWYKYFGRGMEMNREISTEETAEMLNECLAELKRLDPVNDMLATDSKPTGSDSNAPK